MNSYLYSNELPEEGVDVLINIGNSTTTLICWGKNHRFFIRELDIAGSQFTSAVMSGHDIDYSQAIDMKHSKGLESLNNTPNTDEDNNVENDPLAIKVEQKTIFSNLIDELRKTLRYYMKTTNQAVFNKF